MTAHTTTYSHNTEWNVTRLSSRFWGKCARMLSVVAISAVATGSAFATLGAGSDTNPQVDATFIGTQYATARIAGVDSQPLAFPALLSPATNTNGDYYSIVGTSFTTANGGTIGGNARFEAASQTSAFSATNAPHSNTFTYTPAPGFCGQDVINYRVYDATIGANPISVALASITINVTPSLVEAPATNTTTTIAALAGAGVMLVKGTGTSGQPAGTVELTGNAGANTATGGIIVDGGRLSLANNSGFTTPLTIAAKHGAKVDSFASVTFAKVILG
ncbi:MAG: hypothetical protein V4544_00010 [Pseudomonadota bacterium]